MKVYIVEDDEAIRMILKRLLKKNFKTISAIGESEYADKALREVPSFAPDILLVDISLPGTDGIELIKRLRPQCRDAGILVLTGHEIEQFKQAALNAGADGIVSKMDNDELLRSIEKLLNPPAGMPE